MPIFVSPRCRCRHISASQLIASRYVHQRRREADARCQVAADAALSLKRFQCARRRRRLTLSPATRKSFDTIVRAAVRYAIYFTARHFAATPIYATPHSASDVVTSPACRRLPQQRVGVLRQPAVDVACRH
jgi:hypothetical protein